MGVEPRGDPFFLPELRLALCINRMGKELRRPEKLEEGDGAGIKWTL